MNRRKAQSIFDYAIGFIALAALIVGIVRIWVWFNANYGRRQQAYQGSRIVAAGTKRPGHDPAEANIYTEPIQIAGTEALPSQKFQPLNLDSNWVFGGLASGSVTQTTVGGEIPVWAAAIDCDEQCTQECGSQPGFIDPETGGINRLSECNRPCYARCNCHNQTASLVNMYRSQALGICGPDEDCSPCTDYTACETDAGCGQACQMRWNAHEMRDTASECDSFWDGPCNWFGGGKAADELYSGARQLEGLAWRMELTAKTLIDDADRFDECCEQGNEALQLQCLKDAEIAIGCDAKCLDEAVKEFDACRHRLGGSVPVCSEEAEEYQATCLSACIHGEEMSCSDKINILIRGLRGQIAQIEDEIANSDAIAEEAGATVQNCNAAAVTTCSGLCGYTNDPSCFNPCYEKERNECCQKGCCSGSEAGWGRNCDEPATNCDCSGCPACGLSYLASNMDEYIATQEDSIAALEEAIAKLPGCCSVPIRFFQDKCIDSTMEGANK
jgi:hypothetical protein